MSRKSGDRGEAFTANYLRKNGYKLLASQYRCRMGEVDLIAEKKGTVCFVEVKLRSNLAFGLPRDYVTAAKRRRICAAAAWYCSAHELDCPMRFDVAEVYEDDAHGLRLEYLENAFEKE